MLELKNRLRDEAKARRAALDPEVRASAAAAIAECGLEFAALRLADRISAFHPMGDEIDPRPLLLRLARDGHDLCLPVLQGRSAPLGFRRWRPGDEMRKGVWGIEEPLPTAPALSPDVLLVPLLAVDPQGCRLGYGGGYYDRTLRALRATKSIIAIGLGFDQQMFEVVPHADYDERLDWILLPSGPRRCSAI